MPGVKVSTGPELEAEEAARTRRPRWHDQKRRERIDVAYQGMVRGHNVHGDYCVGGGDTGHVAWVSKVDGTHVWCEQYNYNFTGTYSEFDFDLSDPDQQNAVFIHIADIAAPTTTNYTDIPVGTYYVRSNAKEDRSQGYLSLSNNEGWDGESVIIAPFSEDSKFVFSAVRTDFSSYGYVLSPFIVQDKLMNIASNRATSGDDVNIFYNAYSSTQWWKLESVGNLYIIRSKNNPNYVLTAENDNVLMRPYDGSSNQYWEIISESKNPTGTFRFSPDPSYQGKTPDDPAQIYEAMIIENANDLLTQTRPDLYTTMYGYITYINNQQRYYQRTLFNAEKYNRAYNFEIDWGSRAISLLIDVAIGNYNSAYVDVTRDLMESSASELISAAVDQVKDELYQVKPDELIYSLAKGGANKIQTIELYDINDRMVDGRFVNFEDAVAFIRIHQENATSLAAAKMGWAYYEDTLRMSPWGHLENLLVGTLISKLNSYTIGISGSGMVLQEAWGVIESMLGDLLTAVGDVYDKDYVSDWQKSVREIAEETIRLMGGRTLSYDNPIATYLSDIYPRSFERYEGNMGDTCIFNFDKQGLPGSDNEYIRNGNVGINGETFANGFEVWMARWNNREEQSWVRTVYPLYGMYAALSGHTGLIQSYNTTNFDTTISFYDNERELASYRLTPEQYMYDINIDLTGVQELTLYVQDNVAVPGGTSFALSDLKLTSSGSASGISMSREVAPTPMPTIAPQPTIAPPSIYIEDTFTSTETPAWPNEPIVVNDEARVTEPLVMIDDFDFSSDSFDESWYSAFESFVMDGQYLNRSEPYYQISEYASPEFGLYDFDKDGIPELIGFNGADIYAEKAYYVYAAVTGEVILLDNIYARDGGFFSVDDPQAPGLFVTNYQGGDEWIDYFTLSGDRFEWTGDLQPDSPLYSLALDGSKHKYVTFISDYDIRYNLGWDGFVQRCLGGR